MITKFVWDYDDWVDADNICFSAICAKDGAAFGLTPERNITVDIRPAPFEGALKVILHPMTPRGWNPITVGEQTFPDSYRTTLEEIMFAAGCVLQSDGSVEGWALISQEDDNG